jgi:excisionase family DNA binding protein
MKAVNPEEKPLNREEAARLMGVAPETISRWARRGWVPYFVTIGGHRRYLRSELEQIMNRERSR